MTTPSPIPSASVLLLRDKPLRVLMIRRHGKSSFVPNAWVFPGGAVDALDREIASESRHESLLGTMRIAAARELFEETGIWLGAPLTDADEKRRRLFAGTLTMRDLLAESAVDFSRLVWTSHWITPAEAPKRFDTYFFLATAPAQAEATVANDEAVDAIWIEPQAALARSGAGEFELVFPTVRNLEAIVGHESAAALIASRHGVEIPALQPRIVVEDGRKKIVLP